MEYSFDDRVDDRVLRGELEDEPKTIYMQTLFSYLNNSVNTDYPRFNDIALFNYSSTMLMFINTTNILYIVAIVLCSFFLFFFFISLEW